MLKPGMIDHTFNPSTQHRQIYKFKVSLRHVETLSRKTKGKKKKNKLKKKKQRK